MNDQEQASPQPAIVEHVNGHQYKVEGIYRDQDAGVDYVPHVGLHDGRKWVRTVQNFTGLHKSGRPRFKLIRGDLPVGINL